MPTTPAAPTLATISCGEKSAFAYYPVARIDALHPFVRLRLYCHARPTQARRVEIAVDGRDRSRDRGMYVARNESGTPCLSTAPYVPVRRFVTTASAGLRCAATKVSSPSPEGAWSRWGSPDLSYCPTDEYRLWEMFSTYS